MKGLIFSLVATVLILFGVYYAVSQGVLHFPFDKECLMELGMEKDRAKEVFNKNKIDFKALGFFETIHYYLEGGFHGLGNITGISYKLIVTLLYLFFLPLLWLISLDKKTDFHWFKIGYAAIFAAVFLISKKSLADFGAYLFDKCEGFLVGLSNLGLPYAVASVLFCILIPIAMFSIVSMLTNRKIKSSSDY